MDINWFITSLIFGSVGLGLYWAYFNYLKVQQIDLKQRRFLDSSNQMDLKNKLEIILDIGDKISKGADSFLSQEYSLMGMFIVVFSCVVFVFVDYIGSSDGSISFYATFSYIIGALVSMLCGYIGMKIATMSNYRTTYMATESLQEAFKVAFRAGCVMGFGTVSLGLGVLTTLFVAYVQIYQPTYDLNGPNSISQLMELIAGFGLGASSMALFGRVGGGIFTKAADVGADLVGKIEEGLAEDSPNNPATIADNVGDNVGDIAGMGSDLFGSFAEATCATLVLISSNQDLVKSENAIYYPFIV